MNNFPKRSIVLLSSLLFLAITSVFATSLPDQWHAWRYTREIQSDHPGALNYIAIEPDILAHAAESIADVRIVDENGLETPYVVRTSIGVSKTESWQATIRENSFVPGKYTQLVLDLGAAPRFHNAVRLDTPESDFILWVEVDASDDARTWRIVKDRAPISRFRHQMSPWEGNQTIPYSENNARYLRVQIRESEKQFPITGAGVFPASQSQKELVPEHGILLIDSRTPNDTSSTGDSGWILDLGNSNAPINSLEFVTDEKEFYRAVYVVTSLDGKNWASGSSVYGEIYRYSEDSHRVESLRVPVTGYSARGTRYWRVEIRNLNDAPLSGVKLSASMIAPLILFRPAAGHSYRFVYGNEKAQSPRYDLERTLHISAAEQVLFSNKLGPEQENSAYQDPRPFSERHPEVLWSALALAVVLLGYTALRTMRTPPAQQS